MLRFMNYEKKWARKLKAAHLRSQQVDFRGFLYVPSKACLQSVNDPVLEV